MYISSCVGSFFNKLSAVSALVLMAVVCGAGAADALPVYYPTDPSCPPPGVNCPPPSTVRFQGGGQVVGSIFTAQTTQTFNSLGFIDVGMNGLVGSYEVGIWLASTQTLLASTWVTPASPLGVISHPNIFEMFRYAPIPTVVECLLHRRCQQHDRPRAEHRPARDRGIARPRQLAPNPDLADAVQRPPSLANTASAESAAAASRTSSSPSAWA